ncbi:hypothetical protein F511_14724 [Dorcoceras hygrometricum]|uniref:Uncharacterized protein n=1 Tax=Dorcoceras hygrometricum TaxID=472368 RepID=A0A2Z7ASF4_9LAMI|nr:hypothetical protein F511_14724 [Dorcoceras hygrometricum]
MEQGQASNTGALDEKNRARLLKVKPAQTVADQLGEENQIGDIWSRWMLMREMMVRKQKAPIDEKVTSWESSSEPNVVQEQL